MGRMPEQAASYFFFGSDEGAAAAAAQACYTELTAGDEGWGNEQIDGTAATVDEAREILRRTIGGLQMFNMFGGRKVVWLKGANFLADTPQGARSEAVQAGLEKQMGCLE